jgi:hypothetical protein
MPATFYVLLGIAAALWLLGLLACGLAIRWSVSLAPGRRWAALALSLIAAAIGYYELHHFQFGYSQTVNDRTWSLQSKWFFITLCVLGAACVCVAIAGLARRRPTPEPGASPNARPATTLGNSKATGGPPSVS